MSLEHLVPENAHRMNEIFLKDREIILKVPPLAKLETIRSSKYLIVVIDYNPLN